MKRIRSLIILNLVLLASCATVPMVKYDVRIISNPKGANIEIDNNYVGKTPLTATILGTKDRTIGTGGREIKMKALPTRGGDCVQSKTLSGWDSRIPETIYFEMGLCSRLPSIIPVPLFP